MEAQNILLFENKCYSLELMKEENILVINAQGVPSIEILQELWLSALDAAAEYKITKWLNNERDLSILPIDGVKWFKEVWSPLAVETLAFAKSTYTAVVLSDRFYAELSSKLSLDAIHKAQEQKLGKSTMHSKHFRDINLALAWLINSTKTVG